MGDGANRSTASDIEISEISGKKVAEREGFEPSVEDNPYNGLAGRPVQPAPAPLRYDLIATDQELKATKFEYLNQEKTDTHLPFSHCCPEPATTCGKCSLIGSPKGADYAGLAARIERNGDPHTSRHN